MRKFPDISAVLVLFIVGFVLIAPAAAQSKQNKVEDKAAYYEYYAGVKTAASLSSNCSMFSGTIREVKNFKITLAVKEKVFGNRPATDVLEINYRFPPPGYDYYRSGLFSYAPMIEESAARVGNEMVVFLCDSVVSVRYGFVTTDARLFPSIRKAVEHFISYQKDAEVILKIPDLLKTENDQFFIGYLIDITAGEMSAAHTNYAVIALSQLLENDKLPDFELFDLKYQLWSLISGSVVFPITDETRDTALRNLVRVGSSNRKHAKEAVSVLAQIADSEQVDLRPYLNAQNKLPLLENLRVLPQKERAKFEKLLISN